MSKRKFKYVINGVGFYTKKDIMAYCKDILNSNFGELDKKSHDFMDEIFKMHPRYLTKRGKGSYQIHVTECQVNERNNMFIVERSDGSLEDFSYYKCIRGYSPETKIKSTLRSTVRYQTDSFRKEYIKNNAITGGYLICEETGLKGKPHEMHIDHYPLQFEEIVKMWMEENNLTVSNLELVPPEGSGTRWYTKDPKLERSFQSFHKKHAKYRVVLDKVNFQRKKAKSKLPT